MSTKATFKNFGLILGLFILALAIIPANAFAESPIMIDCYFDDWNDIPHTEFGHGNSKSSGALFTDGENLYVHIGLDDTTGNDLPQVPMTLTVNNQYKIKFVLREKNPDNSMGNHINKLPDGNNLNLGVFDNYSTNYWLGDAGVYVNNTANETEFYLSLEAVRQFCDNIPVQEMQTLTFASPLFGNGEITVTGSSTAPYLGILVVLLVSVLIFYVIRRKRLT